MTVPGARPATTPTAVVVALLLLGGCGTGGDAGGRAVDPGERVPTTERALAWLAAEHLGEPTSASRDTDVSDELDGIGAGVVVDGHAVVVAVGDTLPPGLRGCGEDADATCAEIDDGVLVWDEAVAESDPGNVVVVVEKQGSVVAVVQSGPEEITGDPRDLDLAITVEDMAALARDPRVDLTTTQEAVDGGEAIDYWGRPDL